MRDIFINELYKAATKNNKIMLIVNDLGFSVIEKFAKDFPKQFINAGVAEQNMLGLASGIALRGYHVFVYSIGNFPTFRAAEQIRNDVDYHNLPITIVNVGAGVGYGHLGYSHHTIQDYALIRTMPNFLIASPSNNHEAALCVKYLLKKPQPSYLRLIKNSNTQLTNRAPNLSAGKCYNLLNKKSKNMFLVTGGGSQILKKFLSKKKFINYSVFSVPLWGMKYKKQICDQLKKWKKIIVLEDHFVDGGFGSFLKEYDQSKFKKLVLKGLSHKVVGQVGTEEYLLNNYLN